MSKVKTKVENYEVENLIRGALNSVISGAMEEPTSTKKKPYGIECNDWYKAFTVWPFGMFFKSVIPEYRKFRYYKAKNGRDRALIDLTKHYKYRCKFRVPPYEKYRITSAKRIEEAESGLCSFIKKYFGVKNG